jgi:D-3-phosphoglycerate dehydrogenase
MSNVRVVIADAVSTDCDEILRNRGITVERAVGLDNTALIEKLKDADGMIVRSAVTVDRAMIEQMQSMRAIGRAGTGVDNIDVVAATEKGIIVMNTPEGNTISAAEHTLAMMLSMLRKIPGASASLRSGKWDRKNFMGTELYGKRVGVLGLGRIGREVAIRVSSFGVTVLGYDPVLTAEAVRELGIEPATFDQLIEESDIVTLHIPLLAQTRGLIGQAEFARMKKGSYLINCARGGIVDEAALLEALESGRVAGAAFDVFEQEPPTFPNPLIDHPKVIATPHIAASTDEAQQRVALDIATQMADLFEGKGAVGIVNARGLERSLYAEAIPLMESAEKLGALLGQMVGNTDVTCRLTVYGAEATPIVRGLGASFLAGLLSQGHDSRVNTINAEMLAERGNVQLSAEGEGTHHHYTILIQAEVTSGEKSHSAAVTVFGRNETRLVAIDGVWLDVRPVGWLITFENLDQPGVLAAVSAVLAEHGINIADVSLGRREGTGHALTVMRIDSEPGAEVLAHLARLTTIQTVHTLHFDEIPG